jgi:hypothetical protein
MKIWIGMMTKKRRMKICFVGVVDRLYEMIVFGREIGLVF